MKIDRNELTRILALHADFIAGRPGGERAALSGMDLTGADLTGAEMRGVALDYATLAGEDCRGAY